MPPAFLLPLTNEELTPLLFALNAFAQECDGDGTNYSELCDRVADRVRHLEDLGNEDAKQWVRHVGIGRSKHRPQG